MKLKKGFASDNWSGVCPEIMQTLQDVNPGHNEAYGELNDPVSEAAVEKFKQHFGEDCRIFCLQWYGSQCAVHRPTDAFVQCCGYSRNSPPQ